MKTLNDFVTCHQRIADLVIHNRTDLGQGHGMAAFMVMLSVVHIRGSSLGCTIMKAPIDLITCCVSIADLVIHNRRAEEMFN